MRLGACWLPGPAGPPPVQGKPAWPGSALAWSGLVNTIPTWSNSSPSACVVSLDHSPPG
jgi:hypothetical protein